MRQQGQILKDLKIALRTGLCVGNDVPMKKLFLHILAPGSNPGVERDFVGVWVVAGLVSR